MRCSSSSFAIGTKIFMRSSFGLVRIAEKKRAPKRRPLGCDRTRARRSGIELLHESFRRNADFVPFRVVDDVALNEAPIRVARERVNQSGEARTGCSLRL